MDEYTMQWSDAVRAEMAALALDSSLAAPPEAPTFGTLGKALWVQRCLARLLSIDPALNAWDAHPVIATLVSSRSWQQIEPADAASKILASRQSPAVQRA